MTLIAMLIYFVIAVLVLSFAYWVITKFVPPPAQNYAFLVLGLIVLIVVIYLLLQFAGGASVSLPHPRR